jgi:branched-chain amino acid transport system ATP-binding protein
MSAVPLLAVENLRKAFDGVVAVDDASFAVARGEMVAMIGPNGAGKTTCFNLINGQLAPDRGRVMLEGVRIDAQDPARIARRGVARTFQTAAVFGSMSVRENVQLALAAARGNAWSVASRLRRDDVAGADTLLEQCGVQALADRDCATLAYGDLKRVELVLAMAARPRLLLMDEPTAGTTPADRSTVMARTREWVARDGLGVLFTEHDMDIVFGHADRVIVLDRGRVIAQGAPAEVRADARVRAIYLGVDTEGTAPDE